MDLIHSLNPTLLHKQCLIIKSVSLFILSFKNVTSTKDLLSIFKENMPFLFEYFEAI